MGVGYGIRIAVFRTMGDDLFAKTVGEIETMSVRRECAGVVLEFFV